MAATLTGGGKILLSGNSGNAADCQHIATEFVNRFAWNSRPWPAFWPAAISGRWSWAVAAAGVIESI